MFLNAFNLFNKIKNGNILLEDAKPSQDRFKSDLNKIKKEILKENRLSKKVSIQY